MSMSLKNLLDELVKEGKLKRQDTGVNYLNSLLFQEFWRKVRIYLKEKNPQLKLFNEF